MIVSENSLPSNNEPIKYTARITIDNIIRKGILGLASQTSLARANNVCFIRLGNRVNNTHRVKI